MDYYIPANKTVTLPDGRKHRLIHGIHHVPDALANHPSANDHGIKPIEEMTDTEWRMLGLKKPVVVLPPEPVAQPVAEPAAETVAG